MAYQPRVSEVKRPDNDRGGGLGTLVQAEQLMQIALILPCATLIGWGAGWWIDNHFHMHWAAIAGLLFGMVAGMVSVIRMALSAGTSKAASSSKGDKK